MLMHEWIRYRKQQVEKAESEEAAEEEAAEQQSAEAEEVDEAVLEEDVEEGAEEAEPSEVSVDSDEVEVEEEAEEEAPPQAEAAAAESQDREREAVLSSLQDELDRSGESMQERVRQLRARQKQLPIDLTEPDEPEKKEDDGSRSATETRQELVQRLLDPTLTLREAALLLDVCPTTVRRYTNRGLLNCFRTPGNQRRFHLSDVLGFLERRERGEV